MKKLLALSSVLLLSGITWAAQPNNVGSIKASKIVLDQRTLAQINALTPDTTGQMVLCINCTRSAVCVSSGVTNGAWVIAVTSGTRTGATFSGFDHCQ